MRTLISATALVLLSVFTLNAQDQDEPPEMKLVMSSYQCDWNVAAPWMSSMDSLQTPIWQELVNEGMINAWGVLGHDFAGYDNVIIWRVAPSLFESRRVFGSDGILVCAGRARK